MEDTFEDCNVGILLSEEVKNVRHKEAFRVVEREVKRRIDPQRM